MSKIKHFKIKKHMSYRTDELADLLNIDKKTCYRWIEQGMKIIPGGKKPILIMGSDAKKFLKNRSAKKKVRLKRSEYYCLHYKKPVLARKGSTRRFSNRKTALCRVCSGKISRII